MTAAGRGVCDLADTAGRRRGADGGGILPVGLRRRLDELFQMIAQLPHKRHTKFGMPGAAAEPVGKLHVEVPGAIRPSGIPQPWALIVNHLAAFAGSTGEFVQLNPVKILKLRSGKLTKLVW